ncbi:MAG: FAD-dependent oxidoreductase [Clostridia bacterium]|nr:FAD-dependent monooxygenase [Lachnospiraceae bacterium]NCC00664.1 FAD-dependent oxidoreductase [Clostridia bacterium]NCD02676.1 FAD-dependent oxidoreductase [Clostridia bacterium]
MIHIGQIKVPYKLGEKEIYKTLLKKLHIPEKEIVSWSIFKKSIDARKKQDIMAVYTLAVQLKHENAFLKKNRNNNIRKVDTKGYAFPHAGEMNLKAPIVIVGSGPAGLFSGLMLARYGYRPIILERGQAVEERQETVQKFWETGEFDAQTNVQFGEGGAGTFSDGKLNTLVKDPSGRHRKILELFVELGAAPEILYENKPHIGTDILCHIVKAMREEIISLGGQVRFLSKLTDIKMVDGRVQQICVNDREWMDCECLVLALGHSARDTFAMLKEKQLTMTPKSFAIGLRIEHPQEMINKSQYGMEKDDTLGSAAYKLTHTSSNGRGVYTFCMCPGGYVVNASSEEGGCVVNGMSYHGRNSDNANSAIVTVVTPEDFPTDDVLAGVEFQRIWERKAWEAGRGHVPVQLFGDFKAGRISEKFGDVKPLHKGEIVFGDLNQCLPSYVCDSLKEGIEAFGHKIHQFNREDAILSGVETRTSSSVRIERDEVFQSNIRGIYPCGEGAGYAGGITSAAMDGLRIAEALRKMYCPIDGTKEKD